MYNILIVDDQKHIRDGLQAMLRQFPLPLERIYDAANGSEALELLRKTDIELVITDIKMPDMDGLELMEKSREERIRTEYVIISGYSEFAYAQRAIELGAKGYLLKPVKREDLQASIEHVLQEIRTKEALSHDMQHLSEREREAERKELMMFMQGAELEEEWIARSQEQNLDLWRSYRLLMLREERWINRPGADNIHGLESIVYRVYGRQRCICLQHHSHLILAVAADVDPDALQHALQADQTAAILMITSPYEGLRRLPDSFQQLMDLHRHSYLFPEKRMLLPEMLDRLVDQWQVPLDEVYALFQLMGTDNSGIIAERISRLYRKELLQRFKIGYILELNRAMLNMLEEYERVIRPYMGEEAIDIDCLRNLFDYPGVREYIQALQQQILRLNHFYYEYKCSYRNSQDLNEAIRFIHENYHKPLDLAIVSNHVSLNYAYFSNLFKKNIGKGFAEYLRDVRLDRARHLLADTDYKVIEVARMVGYESYKSFTRVFRDVMGMQPTEYRQKMRLRERKDGTNQGPGVVIRHDEPAG